jgi:hypothetical protein
MTSNTKLIMNRLTIALIFFFLVGGCKRDDSNELDSYIVGEIVGFEYNCSTCILKFPNDYLAIKNEFGASRDNYYQTINLMIDTFKINQKVLVKLRKAEENELRACITLYPSYDYGSVYITDFKPAE